MGFEKDLPPGERMVACFRPFLQHLVRLELSRKTIRKHVDCNGPRFLDTKMALS
jgi:hypothetical protein